MAVSAPTDKRFRRLHVSPRKRRLALSRRRLATALVRVGDDQFVERLRSYLDLAPALRERLSQIDYVDVRYGERIYVRPQASGPRPQGCLRPQC